MTNMGNLKKVKGPKQIDLKLFASLIQFISMKEPYNTDLNIGQLQCSLLQPLREKDY